jgi:hypothetical protein
MTVETFIFAGTHRKPSMNAGLSAGELTAQPATVAKALQGKAAVLTADAVIIAYPFDVFTYLHT